MTWLSSEIILQLVECPCVATGAMLLSNGSNIACLKSEPPLAVAVVWNSEVRKRTHALPESSIKLGILWTKSFQLIIKTTINSWVLRFQVSNPCPCWLLDSKLVNWIQCFKLLRGNYKCLHGLMMKTLLVYLTYTWCRQALLLSNKHCQRALYIALADSHLLRHSKTLPWLFLFKFVRTWFCCLNTTDTESNGVIPFKKKESNDVKVLHTNFIECIARMRHITYGSQNELMNKNGHVRSSSCWCTRNNLEQNQTRSHHS